MQGLFCLSVRTPTGATGLKYHFRNRLEEKLEINQLIILKNLVGELKSSYSQPLLFNMKGLLE